MKKLSGPQKLIDALRDQEVADAQERPKPAEKAKSEKFEKSDKPKSSPYQYSLYLLSGQDYSEYKLRQKLRSKGYEAQEIEEAVEKLIEKKYLREEEYKKLLVKKLMRKGKADGLIRRAVEQEQLKVNPDELAELRDEVGVSKEEMLAQLVRKKTRGKPLPTDREERMSLQNKVSRFLLSRGYSYDDIKKAMKLDQTSGEL